MTANAEEPQLNMPHWGPGQSAGEWRPVPDPTKLTTDQLRRELAALREIIETRLDGMDRAIGLQFTERDVRTAAAKAEASFTKQIDQIGAIIQTQEKAMDGRITELKERIDRGEDSSAGAAVSRTERRLDAGQVLTTLSVLAAVIGLLILAFRH